MNNETGFFYLFNDCIEKLIHFLNIGLPIEKILAISQQLLFSNFNTIKFFKESEIVMRTRLEWEIPINFFVVSKKKILYKLNQNKMKNTNKLPSNQYIFIGLCFFFILFEKMNAAAIMETENFANSLLTFKSLLKNLKCLQDFLKQLETNEEIKISFIVLFYGIDREESYLKIKILQYNLEQKFEKMRLFLSKNFLYQHAVNIFLYLKTFKTRLKILLNI